MATDWSQLAYYPHNGVGGPRARKRYLERCVLESIARNQSEAAFASLQTGYGLGTDGSDRKRVKDDYVYESQIWAALLTRSLKMLADQRAYLAEQNAKAAKAA